MRPESAYNFHFDPLVEKTKFLVKNLDRWGKNMIYTTSTFPPIAIYWSIVRYVRVWNMWGWHSILLVHWEIGTNRSLKYGRVASRHLGPYWDRCRQESEIGQWLFHLLGHSQIFAKMDVKYVRVHSILWVHSEIGTNKSLIYKRVTYQPLFP